MSDWKETIERWHDCEADPLRAAGHTRRCHIKQTIGHQTVAEHSYNVAMLCWRLHDREPSAELLKAALFHDLAETVTGDIPAPVKWHSPAIKAELEKVEAIFDKIFHLEVSLSPTEELILKWADSLELMWYCVDQIRLGNQNVEDIWRNIDRFLTTLQPVKNANNELMKVKQAYAIAKTR